MKNQRIMTAAEWNDLLGTDQGVRICALLRPFQESPLELRPPVEGLAGRMTSALAACSVNVTGVQPVSLGPLQEAAGRLPAALADIMRWDMAGAIRRSLRKGETTDLLCAKFGAGWSSELISALSETVTHVHHEALQKRHPDFFVTTHEQMPFDLLGILLAHVHAIATKRDAWAAAVAPFTECYLRGNFPLGILRDGTFVVLVA